MSVRRVSRQVPSPTRPIPLYKILSEFNSPVPTLLMCWISPRERL